MVGCRRLLLPIPKTLVGLFAALSWKKCQRSLFLWALWDTGIDAPMVENIVMVRPTQSPILYQQMRGRGSRLDSRINKKSFRIYDFAGVTQIFYTMKGYNPYSEIAKAKAHPVGNGSQGLY